MTPPIPGGLLTVPAAQAVLNAPLAALAGRPALKPKGTVQRYGMSMWFKVDVQTADGTTSLGAWSGCSGLGVTFGHDKVWSGGHHEAPYFVPTQIEYGQVTLDRAMEEASSRTLRGWLEDVARNWIGGAEGGAALVETGTSGGYDGYKVTITLYATLGDGSTKSGPTEVAAWTLVNAIPVSWSGPTFNSKSNDIAMEKLVLVHRGFLPPGGAATTGKTPASPSQGKLELSYTPPKGGAPKPLTFQYNPTKLNLDRTASRTDKQSVELKTDFREEDKLNISFSELQIEGATAIKQKVDLLWEWMEPEEPADATKTAVRQPKQLEVTMGAGEGWILKKKAELKQVKVTYTRFTGSGVPCRALVQLTLVVHPEVQPPTNPDSRGEPGVSGHVLTGRETLPQLATAHGGDPGAWRDIARLNGVDDAFRTRPGQLLRLEGGTR